MNKIKKIEEAYTKKEIPAFHIGDMVKVMVKIPEGDKVRLHPFEGIVIARKGSGVNASFTVRKVSYGEGIERVFPVYSPSIERVVVLRQGKSKRAKLYYLRGKIGRAATDIAARETSEKEKTQ
jgi:large subunit ribosomal protein L19